MAASSRFGIANNVNDGEAAICAFGRALAELGISVDRRGRRRAAARAPAILARSENADRLSAAPSVYWPNNNEAREHAPASRMIQGHTDYHVTTRASRRGCRAQPDRRAASSSPGLMQSLQGVPR